MWQRPWIASLLGLLVALAFPTAGARAAGAGPSTAVEPLLLAPGENPRTAVGAARGKVAPVTGLEDVLAMDSPARLFGVAELRRCGGGRLDPAILPRALQDARSELLQLRWDAAYGQLARIAEQLPCATDIVPTAPLSDLYFLLGLSASYQGDEALAVRWFSQSLAVSPGRHFDQDQSPDFYVRYLAAMEQHFGSRPVPLHVLRREGEEVHVVVDGRELDPARPGDLEEGFHLLQLRRPDGAVATFQVRVEAGDHPVLATTRGLADAAAQGEAMPDAARQATVAALRGGLQAMGAARAQLVSGAWTWRFHADSGRFEGLRAPVPRIEKFHRLGIGSLLAGGITFGTGLVMGLTSFGAGRYLHPTQPEAVAPRTANQTAALLSVLGGGLVVVSLPLTIATGPAAPPPPRPTVRNRKAGAP
jgi:hypothetical protein